MSNPQRNRKTLFASPARRLIFEQLDVRLPMSADGFVPSAAVVDQPDLIEVRLEASLVDGTPIHDGTASLARGEQFVVDIFVRESDAAIEFKDLNRRFFGIFQARVDLHFDSQVVQPLVDQVSYGQTFDELHAAQLDAENGVFRNLGGIDSSYLGKTLVGQSTLSQTESLVATIPFTTIAEGDPAILPTTGPDGESFLGLGRNDPIPASDVQFRFDPFTILAPRPTHSVSESHSEPTLVVAPLTDPVVLPLPQQSSDEAKPPRLSFDPSNEPSLDLDENLQSTFDLQSSDESRGNPLQTRPPNRAREFDLQSVSISALDDPQSISAFPFDQYEPSVASVDPLTRSTIGRSTKLSEDDDVIRFWRNFDLELLDDEEAPSPLEMQFRLFQLRVSKDDDSTKPKTPRDLHDHLPHVDSVIDAGLADITAWLLDGKYRSWTDSRGQARSQDTGLAEGQDDTHAAMERKEKPTSWTAHADVAIAARLELVEETQVDPFAAHSELMRRYTGDVSDRIDINPSVPASDPIEADAASLAKENQHPAG